jgi:hypothetical protein
MMRFVFLLALQSDDAHFPADSLHVEGIETPERGAEEKKAFFAQATQT